MQIKLLFAKHFQQMLGINEASVTVQEQASVADAIRVFLDENQEHRKILEERKSFLFDELRAIYSVNGKAVKPNHQLNDGDELNVLKAFIGG